MTKIAVITGSNGGLGTELVKTFLHEGYQVIGLDKENCLKVSSKLFNFIETDLFIFSKDIEYRKNILNTAKFFLPENFSSFVLINNAAVQILNDFKNIEWQDWDNSFAINTIAPFFLTQGFIDELKLTKGHVVNISSIHAKLTKSEFTCYAASKAALESLTRSLALEISQYGISVNAIAPAAIDTTMLRESFINNSTKLEKLKLCHPVNDIGSAKNVANLVKSITETNNSFLTGGVIELNGGIGSRLHDPD